MSDKARRYQLHLTEEEMQMLANAVTGFYNVMNRDKVNMNPVQCATLTNVMERFKHAMEHQTPIKELDKKIILLS